MADEDDTWETRDRAIAALSDLLPTMEEVLKRPWDGDLPASQLLADEKRVIALLKHTDRYGHDAVTPCVIAERTFVGSCSSSWRSGLQRYPNYQTSWSEIKDIAPGGACDPFEEFAIGDLRNGTLLAKRRIETGRPQPAGEFGFIVVDLHAAYEDGWRITDKFWERISLFTTMTDNMNLSQCGYQVIRQHDDHAVIIVPTEPNEYDKYLLGALRELHDKTNICLGLDHGQLYYLDGSKIYSEAINRLWLAMRNVPTGGVVRGWKFAAASAQRLATRFGLGNNLSDPCQ